MFFLNSKSEKRQQSQASSKKFLTLLGIGTVIVGVLRAIPVLIKRDA